MDEKTNLIIIDDDYGMCETLSDLLVESGYNVDVAYNGYDAIEMVKGSSYKIALIDIKMPGINGVETYKKIKQIKPSIKVLMMTAYSAEDLVNEALEEGAYIIIYKPFNFDNLLRFIRKIEEKIFIMIVDDDLTFCETFKDQLEEMKYKVAVRYDGMEAIKFIKDNDVDIIFIDVKMPLLNGLDIFQAIKKMNPKITGIMITGYYNEDPIRQQIEEAIKKNLYAYLNKPLEGEKVFSLIDEIRRTRFKIYTKPID